MSNLSMRQILDNANDAEEAFSEYTIGLTHGSLAGFAIGASVALITLLIL